MLNGYPKISVIIPVYNGETFLKDTLESVGESTYKNLEILIVDDGSTDHSSEIYRECGQRDSRIRYVYQKNAGIVAARNRGIEEASGDYICFCDQDDLISKEMYQIMIERLARDQSDLCICGTSRITNDLEKTPFEILKNGCFEKEQIITELLDLLLFAEFRRKHRDEGFIIYGTIWKMMINAVFLKEHGLRFKRFVNFEDDWIMDIELLIHAHKVSTVEDSLYWWRVNTGSESNNWKYLADMDKKQEALDRYMEKIFRANGFSEKYIEEYKNAKACLNIVKVFENEGSPKNPKSLSQKLRFLRFYMKSNAFEEALSYGKMLKRGYIRYAVVLGFLRMNLITAAYLVNKCLKLFAIYSMRQGWGVKLDKGLKKKGK